MITPVSQFHLDRPAGHEEYTGYGFTDDAQLPTRAAAMPVASGCRAPDEAAPGANGP